MQCCAHVQEQCSSCHGLCGAQDTYENVYAVVRGVKSFTLLPPCDAYRLRMQPHPIARYQQDPNGQLDLVLDEPRWVNPAILLPLIAF